MITKYFTYASNMDEEELKGILLRSGTTLGV